MEWITEMSHTGDGVGTCTGRGHEAMTLWEEYRGIFK